MDRGIGDPAVIRAFQGALPLFAQLNLQYRLYARQAGYLGFDKLKDKFDGLADDAGHGDDGGYGWLKTATDWVLFLGADPSYAPPAVKTQRDFGGMFGASLQSVVTTAAVCEQAIPVCVQRLDDDSRNLLEHFVKQLRNHQAWIEKQQRRIAAIGEDNYLSEKM